MGSDNGIRMLYFQDTLSSRQQITLKKRDKKMGKDGREVAWKGRSCQIVFDGSLIEALLSLSFSLESASIYRTLRNLKVIGMISDSISIQYSFNIHSVFYLTFHI